MRDKRDRTKQITLDLTKHPKALKIYTDISINKTAWVADAIEEKHEREKGIIFTPEQQKVIDSLKEEIKNLREEVWTLQDWKEYMTSI